MLKSFRIAKRIFLNSFFLPGYCLIPFLPHPEVTFSLFTKLANFPSVSLPPTHPNMVFPFTSLPKQTFARPPCF